MRDSLNYLQLRHSKLQYEARMIMEGGGLYSKLNSGIPLEIEERVEEHAEEQLQATIQDFLRAPMKEHLLRIKILFAADSCDVIVGTSNGAADTASTGMLANDLLQRYAHLTTDPASAPTTVEIAPMIEELSNIFPSRYQEGFLGLRGMLNGFRELSRNMNAVNHQSPLRLSAAESPASFVTLELSPELSRTIEENAIKADVDVLSAFAAATSIGAKRKLFDLAAPAAPLIAEESKAEGDVAQEGAILRAPNAAVPQSADVHVDFMINHDMRVACFQPSLPNDSMTVAETASYHCVKSGDIDVDRDVWAMAKDIYSDVSNVISSDRLLSLYSFSVTAASVKKRQLSSMPKPSFVFQDARNLAIDYNALSALKISDVRYAETATRGACKVVLSKFQKKLQLSYNFPSGAMSPTEAESIADAAIDLLRQPPSL